MYVLFSVIYSGLIFGPNFIHLADYDGAFNPDTLEINNEAYNNPGVMVSFHAYYKILKDILRELPPFDWESPDYKDNAVRVKKAILLLENGAKYEGEW